VKLLRVLEEHKFERVGGQETLEADIRLIAATNRNLDELAADGRFRQDLFFRLNVLNIVLPPLRDRRDDIPLMVRHFLKEFSEENHKTVQEITPEAMTMMAQYPWPGNVRELRNVIERMVVLSRSGKLTVRDLPTGVRQFLVKPELGAGVKTGMSLEEANRKLILAALAASHDNRTLAAKQLGISRRTLHRKLREYGLTEGEG
ncbi:MAG: sigma-54-dependent Fis family transcriptional regulator, partial [Lentisphaerae bacterium]|nr:sigma-54-dependent Fis family transcriptional regulator [Lentisphaerota bacterium]